MSILEAFFKINLGTSYTAERGIQAIKHQIRCSRKVIVNNIPVSLLEELLPLLEGKKVSVALKETDSWESIEDSIENICFYNADIEASYNNQKMNFGNIVLPNIIFDITWDKKGRIRDITTYKDHNCLKCDYRLNIYRYAEECGRDIYIGKILSPDKGIAHLLKDLNKSEKAYLVYVPDFLVEKTIPLFNGKDVRILLPSGHRVHPVVKEMHNSRMALSFITPNLKFREQNNVIAGAIWLPHIHYCVAWKDNRIIEIRTMEQDSCIHCMEKKHIVAWSTGIRLLSRRFKDREKLLLE
jgi:hypothetical protein